MTWRRVAVIYALLAVLAVLVLVVDRDVPATTAKPTAAAAQPSLLAADAASVSAVTFRKDGRVVRAARSEGRWRATEPAGAAVSPDLIEATIATLTEGQAAEAIAHLADQEPAVYGLDAPVATVEVAMRDGATPSITVAIGARNPTRTAVYARRTDQPTVFLVGMNVSYYIDLIFDAAKG